MQSLQPLQLAILLKETIVFSMMFSRMMVVPKDFRLTQHFHPAHFERCEDYPLVFVHFDPDHLSQCKIDQLTVHLQVAGACSALVVFSPALS